jgi:signal transduction histidine kinase/CheY-like chemotaxis protein
MKIFIHEVFTFAAYSISMSLVTRDPAVLEEGPGAEVLAGVFIFYYLFGRLGLSLHSVYTVATLIWAPSGIALATFVLYGSRVWPAVFAAALMVNATVGAPLLVALGIGAGNTLGPWLGAKFLQSYFPDTPLVAEPIRIILVALLVPVITASLGLGISWLGGVVPTLGLVTAWSTWWIGDMLGILIFAPVVLTWLSHTTPPINRSESLELFVVLLCVVLVSYVVFWVPQMNFAYYIFIPLTWAALRTGARGTNFAMVLVAIIATAAELTGHGRFAAEGLLTLQLFLSITACILLAFSSVVEERSKVFTTLRSRAEELEDALDTIRAEDEAKKEFIDILAHELRNPLATILSSVELITMKGMQAEGSPSLLVTIDERARAMVRLLDDLLDISRISRKKLALQKETISVTQFTEKIRAIVMPLMKRYGHEFSLVPATEELYVRADPVRLEQILLNLLANAARLTKTHGYIQVQFAREGRKLAIHIRDSGVGIPIGMLRRIFEPFFQVNVEEIGNEGIGVGLTLSRELIEMHGGSIEAASAKLGRGSEFIVRLPLMKAPEPSPIPAQRVAAPALSPEREVLTRLSKPTPLSYRILVVDDNEDAANALAQLLELRGHTTSTAHSGSQALTKAPEFKPQVIFLDIGLPDMTGHEVAKRLRESPTPYFLIALSGYGQQGDKEEAKRSGIDQYLTKPAGLKEIQAVLRKVPRPKSEEV